MYGNWDAGAWVWMSLLMLLFVAALVVGVIALIRTGVRDDQRRRSFDREPLDILDERFTHGEIDQQEYKERRLALVERR